MEQTPSWTLQAPVPPKVEAMQEDQTILIENHLESSLESMAQVEAKLLQRVLAWKKDPVLFGRECLGFNPTAQQEEIMRAIAQEGSKVAVKSGINTGKTALASVMIIWFLLFHSPCKAAATSVSSGQLQDGLMPEINLWLERGNDWIRSQLKVNNMRAYVVGAEKTQFLTAKTANPHKPDALQGLHSDNIFVVIDECFGVHDKIIEVCWAALTKKTARLLIMGNPTRTSGFAYRAFNKERHLYKTFTLRTQDSPLVSPEAFEELKAVYEWPDSDACKSRLLGEFPSGSFNQLITMEDAKKAAARTVERRDYEFAPVIFGIDTAWMGSDRSCVYMRHGNYSKRLFIGNKVTVPNLVGEIVKHWKKEQPKAVFIDAGGPAAGGVIDMLKALKYIPTPVNFGAAPESERFTNKRMEMWFRMKEWIEQGGCIDDIEDIITDLTTPEYNHHPNGKMYLESKAQMRKRGCASPDSGDGLALTFAYDVLHPDLVTAYSEAYGQNDECQTDYEVQY